MFNGRGREGCDPFVLGKQPLGYEFCKTNRESYDLAVGLVLVAVAQIAPNVLDIGSNGNWESDWREIREAYCKIFGMEPASIFDDDDDS